MATAKDSPRTYPQKQLDIGQALEEQYRETLKKRAANRSLLRNIIETDPDAFNDEEYEAVLELYPYRQSATDEPDVESTELVA